MRGKGRSNPAALSSYRFIPAYAGKSVSSGMPFGKSAIHPRIRGEKLLILLLCCLHMDSSLYTRGKGLFYMRPYPSPGFIPAYAGKRYLFNLPPLCGWIHPRIRGEKPSAVIGFCFWLDSSPHTRGKVPRCCAISSSFRFIPAYAGKRLSVYAGFSCLQYSVVQFA